MTTLREAHALACAYWDTKGGTTGKVMAMRAGKAVELGGLSWAKPVGDLTASDATRVLTGLRKLALSSRASYYAAFRRMLALSGVSTVGWPSGGTAPRRVREPMAREAAESLRAWFKGRGEHSTATLLDTLMETGMRVEVEALSRDGAWRVDTVKPLLLVKGKGGHERVIPITQRRAAILSGGRFEAFGHLSYAGHLKRWNRGVAALGITSKLPTPHAIRHLYATEAYYRSGCNLRVVAELLGHADINTTARYVGVNMEELRNAAGA